MRSFKSKVLSAVALTAPVLAAVLPHHERALTRPDGRLLNYDLQQNYAQATFSIPCTGCLGSLHNTDQDDESLILNFKSHSQEHACGSSNITLNGVYLPQEWNGDFASGSGSYSGVTDLEQNEWYHQRDLDLEWKSVCLHGDEETDEAAQVLTVSIKAIDGKALSVPSGFTVSFKQHTTPPSLLRLESAPNPSAGDRAVAKAWREPPHHLRIQYLNDTASDDIPSSSVISLEDHIRELKELQAEVEILQDAIATKKQYIKAQLRKEVKEFTDDLSECGNVSCFFKTLSHKAHGAWKIAVIHFQHNHKSEAATMGRPEVQDVYAQVDSHSPQLSGGQVDADVPPTAPYETYSEELPPRPPKSAPYIVALEITLSILCCGCLVAVIRHKCSSLRTRTDRAAAREERDNLRAYRRAARKQAWRNWWRGNWRKDQERIADYEEKRSLIAGQESILETAMQEEIRQLRAAHDVVNDLVRDAEEGRVAGPCNCHRTTRTGAYPAAPYSPSLASTYPPTSIPEAPSRPLSRTESLPSYRSDPPSEPPNYDSEVDMSEVVANGFRQYRSSTGSAATSRWTPDSSVVDVSPRPSADTLRYPQSIFTCDEESDED